jgi:hypothetical protein
MLEDVGPTASTNRFFTTKEGDLDASGSRPRTSSGTGAAEP